MIRKKTWLSSPHMGSQEVGFVREAFAANWIAPVGPHLEAFELDLCTYVGSEHAVVVSSGTAAIHLGLILLGVTSDDEVICQSLTFSGSANPIRYQGATPVFVDSEESTWNLCPEALEAAIEDRIAKGKKPKAVIVVHLYGMPARMSEIQQICDRYEIALIEDAAEALGSRYKGKPTGGFGRLSILSFNGNKIITTSGGGALLSNDGALVERARYLATQARDPAPHYEHSVVGYNYRMSNVLAGIGRGQMLVLEERVRQRRANFDIYRETLGDIDGIYFLPEPEGHFSNRWLTTILVDPEKTGGVTREDLRLALEGETIESRPLWKPMHMQPVFNGSPFFASRRKVGESIQYSVSGVQDEGARTGRAGGDLPVSEWLFERGLCLPSGSNLSQEDLERVVAVVRSRLGTNK